MSNDTLKIEDGKFEGWLLRVHNNRAEIKPPHVQRTEQVLAQAWVNFEQRWDKAPLRILAKEFTKDEAPWPWLRERGIKRPTPRGARMKTKTMPESKRLTTRLTIRLIPRNADFLREEAARFRMTMSAYISLLISQQRVRNEQVKTQVLGTEGQHG